MRPQGRKSAPKVVDGRVQKKNNHAGTYRTWAHNTGMPVIEKDRTEPGHRHLLTVADVEKFISILPDWEELARGLRCIMLSGSTDSMGWCTVGTVAVCAWAKDLWLEWEPDFYKAHKPVLDLLEVEAPHKLTKHYEWHEVQFTENQAKGFQLLHILLHELGHHHDRMLHKGRKCNHGEGYAEAYAFKYMDIIWPEYVKRFPVY